LDYILLFQESPAVRRLMEMGFPAEAARKALDDNGGDENAAINSLLS
jgi:uncharacterized UBP type Zn finger protein